MHLNLRANEEFLFRFLLNKSDILVLQHRIVTEAMCRSFIIDKEITNDMRRGMCLCMHVRVLLIDEIFIFFLNFL